MTACEDALVPRILVVRDDHRDPGPNRAITDDERPVAPDERGVTDTYAGDIGDRVQRPARQRPDRDAEVRCSHGIVALMGGCDSTEEGTPRGRGPGASDGCNIHQRRSRPEGR